MAVLLLSSGTAIWTEHARLRHKSAAVSTRYHHDFLDDLTFLYDSCRSLGDRRGLRELLGSSPGQPPEYVDDERTPYEDQQPLVSYDCHRTHQKNDDLYRQSHLNHQCCPSFSS